VETREKHEKSRSKGKTTSNESLKEVLGSGRGRGWGPKEVPVLKSNRRIKVRENVSRNCRKNGKKKTT